MSQENRGEDFWIQLKNHLREKRAPKADEDEEQMSGFCTLKSHCHCLKMSFCM